MNLGAYVGIRPDGTDARRAARKAAFEEYYRHYSRCRTCLCRCGGPKKLKDLCAAGREERAAWLKAESIKAPLGPHPKPYDHCEDRGTAPRTF